MSLLNQQLVERYIAACSAGDRDELLAVLAQDAIHYFSPIEMKPIRGAGEIAQFWLDTRAIQPHWSIDNMVGQDDQVVIEFTCTFLNRLEDSSPKTLNRGCEWYRIEGDEIVEIRAYFESDYSRDAGLTDFPYEARGYTKKADA